MRQSSVGDAGGFTKDHTYELVTTYNNRTDKPIDVMGIVYAYLLDKDFDRLASRSSLGLGVRKVVAQQSVED